MADRTWRITYQTADGLESGTHFLEVGEGEYPPARIQRAVSPSLRLHDSADDYPDLRRREYEVLDLNTLHASATYREVVR